MIDVNSEIELRRELSELIVSEAPHIHGEVFGILNTICEMREEVSS